MTDVIFKGPISKLRGDYYHDNNPLSPTVVLLYPESKDGTQPKIVSELIRVMRKDNFSVFVFNFKRIEPISTTDLDKRELELFEVIAVLNWLNEKNQDRQNTWLLSLFSTVPTGLQLVMRRPEIHEYILISPPAKMKDFSYIVPCSSNGIILHESNIETSAVEIIDKMIIKNESCISNVVFDDANFEAGKNIGPMIDFFDNYIKRRVIEDIGKNKKIKRDRRRRKKKKSGHEEPRNAHINPVRALDFNFDSD